MAGIEPATDGLRNRCSTAELHWRPKAHFSDYWPEAWLQENFMPTTETISVRPRLLSPKGLFWWARSWRQSFGEIRQRSRRQYSPELLPSLGDKGACCERSASASRGFRQH